MNKRQVEQVRRFNRIVTQHVGALQDSYLQRGRPLGQARLLHEVDSDSIGVRLLRERLKFDSGYLSRLLRSLESQGLVQTDAHGSDGRVRRVVLTPKGRAERETYDALSDELARSFLRPLDPAQRDRLVSAMAEVERLLRAGAVELRPEAPNSAAAQWCLERYFAELTARFEVGFDPARSNSASIEEMTPPAGFFVVAWLDDGPAGCGALKVGEGARARSSGCGRHRTRGGLGSPAGCYGGWRRRRVKRA